ncbi:MAG: helix-turn-helix domain-containing protein, partial [Acetobacteraceae bacterium]|nr:helix-turn-helix domain-containing protein [Acetobacteraceae bacterium]
GVYRGRKPTIEAAEVRRLREQEKLGPATIARRLGIGRASVYRVLGKPLREDAAWLLGKELVMGGYVHEFWPIVLINSGPPPFMMTDCSCAARWYDGTDMSPRRW